MRGIPDPTLTIPPPPPSPEAFKLPMLYYGLVVVATAAVVLAVYNFVISKWCATFLLHHEERTRRFGEVTTTSQSFQDPSNYLLFSFRYNKGEGVKDVVCEQQCVVCLSAFEDGEEIRRLPACSHSFHAPCIDMWLYSHCDCPLCRTPVPERSQADECSIEHSREGMLGSSRSSLRMTGN